MGLMKPRVSSYVDRGNELIAKGKTKQAMNLVSHGLQYYSGQAGKDQAQSFMKLLAGFTVKCIQESGDKVTRAEPFSAQWLGLEGMDKGNVDVLIAPWNEEYFNECENFPQSKFKDMVDASSSAFTELESGATYSAPPKDSQLGKSSYWNK